MFWLGSILSNNGSGPYGVTIWTEDNTKYDFWFKFQWLQYLYQSYAKRNGLKEEGAIVYSNKVWRVWKLRHNIAYRLHYKYDRPYGMGIYAKIPYRWTFKLKHADKVEYTDGNKAAKS